VTPAELTPARSPAFRLTLALVLALALPLAAAAKELKPWTGGAPPPLVLNDLEGREHRLDAYRGKVVVLNFWATWCDPCRDQLPVLELLARAHAGDGLKVYGVAVDEDRAQLEAFLAATPLGITVLWDKGGARHTERLDVQRLPTTIVTCWSCAPQASIHSFQRKPCCSIDRSASPPRRTVGGRAPTLAAVI
jgi:thiol-disulfide isomerase/thioredoxin